MSASMKKAIYGAVASLIVTAVIASAVAIADVQVLKVQQEHDKEIHTKILEEIKGLRSDLKAITR